MAESPAAVELMLRLDLPPRLRAQALATLSRCGSLPTFAANSLLQSLVPARDPHFKCPARRVPPALFSRRRVRTGEGSADLERAGGASAARRHPLSVVLPVVCSFLSDDDALCLADTCSWMRSSLLGGHHWLPQRTRALWTCPPELPRWTPATVSAPGMTAAGAGPGGGVLPAHLDPTSVLREMPPLQRRVALRWLARTRACPFCAVAAGCPSPPAGEAPASASSGGAGRCDAADADDGDHSADGRAASSAGSGEPARAAVAGSAQREGNGGHDGGGRAGGPASGGCSRPVPRASAAASGAGDSRAALAATPAANAPRRAGAGWCPSLRPAVFGFASAGVVDAVRDGRAVFGADFLPAVPWHWHCIGCFRQFVRVPVPLHWRAKSDMSPSQERSAWKDATDLGIGASLDPVGEFVAVG